MVISQETLSLEEKLSIGQIRDWVAKECKSEAGAAWVYKAKFSSNFKSVQSWLEQTGEMIQIKSAGELPNQHFFDLSESLTKIKVDGTFLEGSEYIKVATSIRALNDWIDFLNGGSTPRLSELGRNISIDTKAADLVDTCIDEHGEVRDSASPELAAIRKRISQAERSARSVLNKILKKSIHDELSSDDSQVTLRDGRLVIPVRAENKRSISGLVHDESATGQTVYLEPTEALELNNEVRELKNRERREVIRILISLADKLRDQLPDLEKGSVLMEKLDFIHAKAVWGKSFNGLVPMLKNQTGSKIENGFHPILWKTHDQAGKSVVPLNLEFNPEQRIIVVSGPNAGGKSVVLKTVGLLQYLVQCGFPVPVAETSEFGIFEEILLDIGDTQSIEDDLSTYSAHLRAMKQFLARSSKKTLVLIDEFGKGTEPQFGGAIAESILKSLNESKCYGVITTHYQNLKDLADSSPGMVNGAMKFDIGKLEPLFKLEIGKPGSSFAFEIATKIGLPKGVIEHAKSTMSSGQVDFDQSLSKLEKEKQKYQKLADRVARDQKQAAQIKKDYEELREMVEEEKKRVLREAKQEAKRILSDANKDVEKTIRDIKESAADKRKTKQARQALEDQKSKLDVEKKTEKRSAAIVKAGDQVKMDGHDGVGEIIKIKGKEAEVQFGQLKSFVKLDRLMKVSGPKKEKEQKSRSTYNRLGSMMNFSHELSIIGMRGEEALPALDSFIDKAIMLGVNEVRIVHGKGHGILRDLVRKQLSDHPHISEIKDEHVERGGSGISVVSFE